MKKLCIKILISACIVCILSACDTKTCYCYNYTGERVYESTEYIDMAKQCKSLNRGTAGNTNSRVCVEAKDRMDVNQIAYK